MPLSVAIITLNEEENIRACLESVAWADEIVVVDSGSLDNTREICREFNCRIIQKEWPGFGRQKNFAVSQCTHDWVLNIDADERLTPELQSEIRKLSEKCAPVYHGYYIARQNFFLGRWIKYGGWYPDYNLRLFNRREGKFNERQVHEAVQLNGNGGYLTNPLQHYTYKSVSDYYQRMERYSNLAAQQMYQEGRMAGISGLLLHPLAAFFRMYFFKMGFRDGYYGLVLAGLYTAYTFAKYAKLWELQDSKGKT
ncbi:MAG: glycosyltransferase family 2 protein [Candidatus Schekmanbacteria bacterium]|nr:glycosyltransferase family 2 protein [Candidatus Schekmanbacteria bacterium]